jgi:iron complex transport system permease protein
VQRAPESNLFSHPSFGVTSGLLILMVSLLISLIGALMNGAFQIHFVDVVRTISMNPSDEVSSHVLLNLRLPRVLLGMIAGASLGVAGAVMQALFRNPLAEPGLVGLSAGSSLGAVLAIVLTSGGMFLIGSFAFVGGVIATALAYLLGNKSSHQSGLLLAGIAINSIGFGVMGLIVLQANDTQLRDLTFWNMGSLASADWSILLWLIPWSMILMAILLFQWRALNALLLGEREAFHLGFDLARLRWKLIALVALTIGPMVAVTGGIGFVGLVVPHLVRMWLGADHRWVLPASCIAGALALTLADLVGRVAIAPAELPIGLVTSMIGGPFFMWLLLRGSRL